MKRISLSRFVSLLSLASLIWAAGVPPVRACSTCGCSLSADWAALGYDLMPGFEAGLRYEYFDQSDLRSGTGSADRAAFPLPNNAELQQRTLNRNTWFDLGYAFNRSWSLTASVPFHDRFHTTIAEGDTEISTSRASGLGDLRLLARYESFTSSHGLGFQFGLKLPTGRFDQTFAEGPQAGELLDRGLQLGTGTTDMLAGISWFARPAESLGAFLQLTAQQPLAARDHFLPSASLNLSGGLRWLNSSRFTPQLQFNVKAEGREHGSASDRDNSGGTLAYLNPGLTAELAARTRAYVFVQLPVYQRVNGLQLEPKWIFSAGVSQHF